MPQLRAPHGSHAFPLAGTRARIVTLLRRASLTVDEIARALGLTDNAVRAHLTTLERDGLVRESGRRRTSSKPAAVYDLTRAAEDLFARAYSPVLGQLLEELNERLQSSAMEELMGATGRRLGAQWPLPQGSLESRLQGAVDVLNGLGGVADLETHQDAYVIQGYTCALAAVVAGHPEVCRLTQSLLTELVGVPVQEQCVRHERAACHFVVPTV